MGKNAQAKHLLTLLSDWKQHFCIKKMYWLPNELW